MYDFLWKNIMSMDAVLILRNIFHHPVSTTLFKEKKFYCAMMHHKEDQLQHGYKVNDATSMIHTEKFKIPSSAMVHDKIDSNYRNMKYYFFEKHFDHQNMINTKVNKSLTCTICFVCQCHHNFAIISEKL